jgi:hypothetical protein
MALIHFKLLGRVYFAEDAFCPTEIYALKNASNKFKSGASIQKRIHLRYCRRNDFEVKRKRSSVVKWGFK